jgi:hypothetical protein
MATVKKVRKLTRAAKMREYFTANPTATVTEVAKKFKTSYQVAYMCKRGMVENSVKDAGRIYEITKGRKLAPQWENLAILSSNKSIKERRHPVTGKILMQGMPMVEDKITMAEPVADPVNHPTHYTVGGIETIDFIEAKDLSYHLGNAVKYISRADHKGTRKQDLEKAKWYIDRAIAQI